MEDHYGCALIRFWKFCTRFEPNQILPRAISRDLLVAAVIIQYSGNTEKKEQMIRKMYVGISLLWIAD